MRREFPRNTGMLVVTEVLPGIPSEKVLQPGDMLVRVNGHYVSQFEPLEEVLDDSVGGRGGSGAGARRQEPIREAPGRRPARHHPERLRGVRRCGGAHALLPAGAAPQRADPRRVRREPRLRVRRRRRAARCGDHWRSTARRPTPWRISRPASRSSAMASARRVRYLTIEDLQQHASCAPSAWTGCGSRRITASATTPPGCGTATTCRPVRRPSRRAVSATQFPRYPRCRARRARPLARDGDLRHAVLGLGRHRAQLSRHRARRRCAARPGGRRPQHRAGSGGRRAPSPSPAPSRCRARWCTCIRCTTSPWSPTTRSSSATRRCARARLSHARARAPASRSGWSGLSARQRAARAQHRDRQHRSARAAAVAHHALPRQQSRDRAAGQPAGRIRRRAGRQRRQRAGHLVELRLRERPRDRPGQPRLPDRRGRRHDRARTQRQDAALARGGTRRNAARAGARDRPAAELDAAPRAAHRQPPPGTGRDAPRRRLATPPGSCSPATCCSPSTATWSRASARSRRRPPTASTCR